MTHYEMTNDAVLLKEDYLSLKTLIKHGNERSTLVWFAQEADKIYVVTLADSGKVKRIRNNEHVKITPSNGAGIVHGKTIDGMAEIHPANSEIGKHARDVLHQKYGIMLWLYEFVWWLQGNQKVYIEITTE